MHYCLFVGQCVQQAANQLHSKHIEIRHDVSANEYPYYEPKHYTILAIIHVKENIAKYLSYFCSKRMGKSRKNRL